MVVAAAVVVAIIVYCCHCRLLLLLSAAGCCRRRQLGGIGIWTLENEHAGRSRGLLKVFDGWWCDVAEITYVMGNITGNPEPVRVCGSSIQKRAREMIG